MERAQSLRGAAFTLNSNESMVINGSGASVSSSSLTLAAGSSVTQSNGTLSSAVVNIGGTYTYSGGSFSPSVAFIQESGELTQTALSNSTVIQLLPGGLLAGTGFINTSSGQLTGSGVVTTGVTNQGTVEPNGGVLSFTGAFSNTGSIIVPAGSEGLFNSFPSNGNTISLNGGIISTSGAALTNSGQILGYGTLETGALTNNGALSLAGYSSVYGSVTNNASETIHLSGTGPNVFYGAFSNSGTLTIDAGASGTVYGAYTGSGKIIDNGSLYLNANSVTGPISGNGNLTVGSSSSGPAVVELASNTGVSTLASLSLIAGSTLDITNNKLFIDYGSGPDPIASIEQWIKNGYYGLSGPSIISSAIATDDAASGLLYGIGYADGAEWPDRRPAVRQD